MGSLVDLEFLRLADDLEVVLKHKVPIVITSLSAPTALVPRVHKYGGIVFHDVIKVRHAEKALEAGVDGIIAVCGGAGGHAGNVKLPINVTVTDAKRAKVKGDVVSVDATVAVDNPIGYFSTVRTVTFDIPEGTRPGEFEVFVGFDQGAQGAG